MKKLIIIENDNKVQCDTLQEIVKILIDEDYYEMTDMQKKQKMKMKALANCINVHMEITDVCEKDKIDEKFIIKDEITYILSLLMMNRIILLEHIESNIFTQNLNKNEFTDNYIIVNKFAKQLLKDYLD